MIHRISARVSQAVARRRLLKLALPAIAAFVGRHANAGETTLAEPIIEENITDVDGTEIGTLEVDVTGAALASRASRKGLYRSSLEAEWRPLDRLGVGAELAATGTLDAASPLAPRAFVPRVAGSYVVLRDRERVFYLQAETSYRHAFGDEALLHDPTESALPFSSGLRMATQAGPFTIRAALFVEAGGASAHVPLRAGYAVLANFFGDGGARFYVGAEAIADWARERPFAVVPEALFLTRVLDKPMRFGLGVPTTVGARGEESSFGIAFRIVLEPDE
jgi:hypothetical protein